MNREALKLFTRIILFTIIISYTLDKLVFFSLNTLSDKVMSGQSIGKLNQFLTVKDSMNFIVFGNSRANHHIDPTLFDVKGFNIGVDGTSIAYSSVLISTLQKNKNQNILVHLDTKDFLKKEYDGSDILALKTKYKRNDNISRALLKSGKLSALNKIFFSINYNGSIVGILKNFIKPNYNYKFYNGYDPLSISKENESSRDKILAKKVTKECKENFEVNSVAINYLKEIVDYSKQTDKKFIFITSPLYNDDCSSDNKVFQKIMDDFNLVYYDFSNLFKNSNDNSLWKDRTHLSKKGAEKFSSYLVEFLK